MVFGCGAKFAKCMVFFFNFLAFLAGVILLGGCAAAYASNPVKKYVVGHLGDLDSKIEAFQSWDAALIVGMVVGGFLLVLGFLGCCGAIMEKQWMLGMFIVIMTIMLIIQFTIAGLVIGYQDKVHNELTELLNETAQEASAAKDSNQCKLYTDLNTEKVCCGFNGKGVTGCLETGECTNSKDCPSAIWDGIKNAAVIGGACILGVILLQLGAIIFSSCLCCAVRNGEKMFV